MGQPRLSVVRQEPSSSPEGVQDFVATQNSPKSLGFPPIESVPYGVATKSCSFRLVL